MTTECGKRKAFEAGSTADQIGLAAHKAICTQLLVLTRECNDDPEMLHSVLGGALAGLANFALIIARKDSHREMQDHVQRLIPWAFDQAASMSTSPRADA